MRASILLLGFMVWVAAADGSIGVGIADLIPPEPAGLGGQPGADRVVISMPNGERSVRWVPRGLLGGVPGLIRMNRMDLLTARAAPDIAIDASTTSMPVSSTAPAPASARGKSGSHGSPRTSGRRTDTVGAGVVAAVGGAGGADRAWRSGEAGAATRVGGWMPGRDGGGRYVSTPSARVPAKPGIVVAVDTGVGGAEITWENTAHNQAGFQVVRAPAFEGPMPSLGPGVTAFVDKCGRGEFTYRVRAINDDAQSGFSDPVTVRVTGTGSGEPAVIRPGSGWIGPTPEPGAVGAPGAPGYDAKVIARFDAVPYESFHGDLDLGVVAFHCNEIERVDFAVDGGEWAPVTGMSLNGKTGVWEYVARLRAQDCRGGVGGPVEVRAIVWPVTGEPRVLGPLPLYAGAHQDSPVTMYVSPHGSDSTGTGAEASPFRSINKGAKAIEIQQDGDAGGGVINLMAGEHAWGPAGRDADGAWITYPVTSQRYLTVQSAPGLSRRDVRITSSLGGGIRTKLVHIRNVSVVGCELDNFAPPTGGDPVIWIDGCTFTSSDITHRVTWVSVSQYAGGAYVTDSVVREAAEGWSGVTLARGCTIDGIGDDAFVNCLMIVNCEVRNIVNPEGTGFHADVFQYHTVTPPFDNVIIYGVRALHNIAQAWHVAYTGHVKGPDWSNFAMVNILDEQGAAGYNAQWIPSANHVLWWNLTIPVGPVFIEDNPNFGGGHGEPTTIRNMSVRNCVFQKFNLSVTGDGPLIGDVSWADQNHFIDATSYGAMIAGSRPTTGGTTGQLFNDAVAGDYSAKPGSMIAGRAAALNPGDALGRRVPALGAIGALQPTGR